MRPVLAVLTDVTAECTGVVRPGDTVTIRARKVFFRRMKLRAEVEMMQSLLRDPEAAGPRPEPAGQCDLLPLVQGLAGTYRLAHEGRLRIAFESDVSALVVAADPMAVGRAVRNVLDNAVKFTPPGGEVRVRAGRQGGEAFVAVSDTGPGVAADEREKVFDFRYRGEAARSPPDTIEK